MKVAVGVDRWAAWHPREPIPRVDFLPPMQRRRLSPLARVALDTMWRVVEPNEHLPTIFASRHGEIQSTCRMLWRLCAGEPLSAVEFSHSVHNALVGQASIFRGDCSESVALCAGSDTLPMAMVEAAGLLLTHEAVLVVACDEPLPWLHRVELPCETERWALVMRLHRQRPTIEIESCEAHGAALKGSASISRGVAQLLAKATETLTHQGERTCWQWSRRHVA